MEVSNQDVSNSKAATKVDFPQINDDLATVMNGHSYEYENDPTASVANQDNVIKSDNLSNSYVDVPNSPNSFNSSPKSRDKTRQPPTHVPAIGLDSQSFYSKVFDNQNQLYENGDDPDDGDNVEPSFLTMLDEDEEDQFVRDKDFGSPKSLASKSYGFGQTDAPEDIDFYAVLGVPHDADLDKIRAAYRRLSRLFHPDKLAAVNSGNEVYGTPSEIGHQLESSEKLGDQAKAEFARINEAYAVLTDEKKRAIYDHLGCKGLQMEGLELALRDKSPAEMHLEWMRLRAKHREEQRLNLLQPTSEVSLGIDMSDFFDRFLKEDPSEHRLPPQLTVYEMVLRQSVRAGSSLRSQVNLVGEVLAHNGIGVGTWLVMHSYRLPANSSLRPLAPATIDTELSYGKAGKGLGLGVTVNREFGERCSARFGVGVYRANLKGRVFTCVPGVNSRLQYTFNQHVSSSLSAGFGPGFATGVTGTLAWMPSWGSKDEVVLKTSLSWRPLREKISLSLSAQRLVDFTWIAAPNVYRQRNWKKKKSKWKNRGTAGQSAGAEDEFDDVYEDETYDGKADDVYDEDRRDLLCQGRGKISGSLTFDTIDVLSVSMNIFCPISPHTAISSGIHVSGSQGVRLRLALQRGTQSYILPIILSTGGQPEEIDDNDDEVSVLALLLAPLKKINPTALSYGVVVPLLALGVIRSLLYDPWLQRQLIRAQSLRRQRLRNQLAKDRRTALDTQALMILNAARQRELEQEIGGCVILLAVYGRLDVETLTLARSLDTTPEQLERSFSSINDTGGPVCVTVTLVLQTMVSNSQLRLPPGRWSDIQGFYDPCRGLTRLELDSSRKNGSAHLAGHNGSKPCSRQLFVRYLFHNAIHQVVVDETQYLAIPMEKHLLEST